MTKRGFRKILYDHWIAIFTVVLGGGGVIFLWTKLKKLIFVVFYYEYSGWILAGIVIVIFVTVWFVRKIKKRPSGIVIISAPRPPVYIRYDYGNRKLFNVLWRVWSGNNSLFSPHDDGIIEKLLDDESRERLWVDGPFCPKENCGCELDEVNNRWMCVRCDKKIKIPKRIRGDIKEKVIKIFESELRKCKKDKDQKIIEK